MSHNDEKRTDMTALVVVESCWGNTAEVAEAIAAGLGGVRVVAAADAPTVVDADLVLAGAPTHMRGLPNPKTREMATKQGGSQVPASGLAEWLASATFAPTTRIVTFDTRVRSMFAGSAAKAAGKVARGRGLSVDVGEGFIVQGTPPVLEDDALEHARSWAASLR